MSASVSSNLDTNYLSSVGAEVLSIALIGPDQARRKAVAGALARCQGVDVREFSAYPPALGDVPRLLEEAFDVILIDLDSNPEYALELVESISIKDSVTVMVYSASANQEMVVRSMRAGAREYLDPPFEQSALIDSLVRASVLLRHATHPAKKTGGKLLVFLGAKGGSGVTTLACRYATALARQSDGTLLIDLGLPLGDAALNLGITADYSTDDALKDPDRLDAELLLALTARHESGVSVLASPGKVPDVQPGLAETNAAVGKLVAVARETFEYVIVDVGSRLDLMGSALFRDADKIYLVTQAGLSELRNSNRLISQFFHEGSPNLEIVINRFDPSHMGVTEESVIRALGMPVRWKIPDDYDATHPLPGTDTAHAGAASDFDQLIFEMATSVNDHPLPHGEKMGPRLIESGRNGMERTSAGEQPQNLDDAAHANPETKPTVTWPAPATIAFGTPLGPLQLNARASVAGTFVYTPGPGYQLPVGTHTLWVTFTPAGAGPDGIVQSAVSITVEKATPSITWPAPAAIPSGAALSEIQLNARSSVPGTFVYTPAAGQYLRAGVHTLSVTFNPAENANYTPAHATVSVTVARATPTIQWQAPAELPFGTPLGENELNATASVPGTFSYKPAAGEKLPTGTHKLTVTFTPSDTEKYTPAQASVPVSVAKAPITIAWNPPYPITYGTRLSAMQLNATASVPGSFVYTPAAGAVLAAGEHPLSVMFTPKDAPELGTARAAVMLTVSKAKPGISWPAPKPIACGTPLSVAELNATASVPGSFTYTPAAGELLEAGPHTLSVTFTPADGINYEQARASIPIMVIKQSPSVINWPAPPELAYGTALGAGQLNATASVPGTFVYTPAAGIVLTAGRHTLSVAFAPTDGETYAPAQATVQLVVGEIPELASLLAAAKPELPTYTQTEDYPGTAESKWEVVTGFSKPVHASPRETRTYKGMVYEKGEDGQWHRQQN